ncbi:MAG: hypothetical protein K9L25_11440, partial [Methylovulum sp.]|nr:hypothetical protein [Methylovulum sp.]
SHLALDGMIRRIDDPFWKTHSPPNGYRCRCSIRSLSEHQAKARSGQGKGLNQQPVLDDGTPALPDKGWDYNPSDRLAGVNKALVDKRGKVSPVLIQALDAKIASMEIINNEFIPAKTVKEAEKYLIDNNIVDFADFGKIKDVAIVNEWNKALFETITEFPELRANQKFTGSCQAQYAWWHKKATADYIDKLIKIGYSKDDAEYWAKLKVKKPTVTGTTMAHSWSEKQVSGIAINEKYSATAKGITELDAALKRTVKSGFHPQACDTVKSLVDHELGHQLDDLLNLNKDQEIINLFNTTTEYEVSRYARRNIKEFIAESWAEFKNNQEPRITSKKIGEIITARYRTKYSH